MLKSLFSLVAVVLVAGCSGPAPAPKRAPGELAAGVAEVSIGGENARESTAVSCSPEGTVTMIETGTERAGTSSAVDSADGLTARSVEIRDVNGFTGSYWQDLGDAAGVTLTGRTYLISGTAMGFSSDNPSARVAQNFSIRVSC